MGVVVGGRDSGNNDDPHPASLRSATLPTSTRGRVGARCLHAACTLTDGETLHNAFFDRNFREDAQ